VNSEGILFENPNAQPELLPAVPENPSVEEEKHYRGVTKIKQGKYGAKIKCFAKDKWLGTFDTAIEATKAYDKAALEYHCRKAKLNFPIEAGKSESNAAFGERKWSREEDKAAKEMEAGKSVSDAAFREIKQRREEDEAAKKMVVVKKGRSTE
jgi:EREBP-like factor